MTRKEKLYLEDITFECPKCRCKNFTLDDHHINGYGELACPKCYTKEIRVVFLKYKKSERRK